MNNSNLNEGFHHNNNMLASLLKVEDDYAVVNLNIAISIL